jgi:putative endonuclease
VTAFFLPVVEKSYQVYVLQNEQGKFYIGLSEDVDARLLQHNNGESKWTSKYRPWRMAWTSDAMLLSEARKLENKLKRAKGGNGFYAITGLERK